ncbi:MAG: efflux RND transporter periplasmic adaptor subunit [Chlorobi bacterium]|nr:efflux RND transporter periplasmic adaptor subunit [Chlorobiota bacterium]
MKNHAVRNIAIAAVAVIVIILFIIPGGDTNLPTVKVTRGEFNVLVVESGTVRSKNSFAVTAPRTRSMGTLQIVYLAPEGTTAKKGDVLVRFDPSAALKQIAEKENELKAALSDLDKLKAQQAADRASAEADFENAKLSFELAKISRERMQFESEARKREAELEFKKAELAFKQARLNLKNRDIVRKSELGNLRLRINQIKQDISDARKDMERLTIKAPISGLIVYETNWSTGRKIAVGDQPWPGMPIISLPDLSEAQIVVSINEMDISKIKKGQKVLITPDAFPDRKYTGVIASVSQIGREKGFGSNIKVFECVIDVDKTDEILKPGITTTNKIIVSTFEDVLSLPIDAVFEKEGRTFVYKREGGSFVPVEITTGAQNENFVIVEKGLKEGDVVSLVDPEQGTDIPAAVSDRKTSPAPASLPGNAK